MSQTRKNKLLLLARRNLLLAGKKVTNLSWITSSSAETKSYVGLFFYRNESPAFWFFITVCLSFPKLQLIKIVFSKWRYTTYALGSSTVHCSRTDSGEHPWVFQAWKSFSENSSTIRSWEEKLNEASNRCISTNYIC